jgi:MFS transporter, ACS family, DAL5 transporter family protein
MMPNIKLNDLNGGLNIQFQEDTAEQTWSLEEERRVRRKIDLHVVPMITIMYLFCFLDRSNVGNARIQGMEKDLRLFGYKFNWVLTTFYLSYTVVEIPSNIILKRIGAKIWLPLLTVAFGIICIGTAFVHTFPQLIVLRLILGIAEGGMFPGISYYLSCFYKREELLFRIGIFATSASMAGAFGGLLATGLTKIPEWGARGSRIHTWRNIFFFEGLMTVFIGIIAPRFLPTTPGESKFLTEREKTIASQRLITKHNVSHPLCREPGNGY